MKVKLDTGSTYLCQGNTGDVFEAKVYNRVTDVPGNYYMVLIPGCKTKVAMDFYIVKVLHKICRSKPRREYNRHLEHYVFQIDREVTFLE